MREKVESRIKPVVFWLLNLQRGTEREPWKRTKFESKNRCIDHKLGY